MSTINIKSAVAASAAIFLGFVAQAATQEWSGEKSFTASTTISDDISITEEVSVEVGSGATVTLAGAVSGSARIIKKGVGALSFNKTNSDLSSPIVVSNGTLSAASAVNNAWGTGKITLCCTGTKVCKLNPAGTYGNEIEIDGDSSSSNPAIYLAAQTTFSGKITSAGDLYISTSTYASKTLTQGNSSKLLFNGEVDATGHAIVCAAFPRVYFGGKVTCDELYGSYAAGGSDPGYNCGSIQLHNPANRIGKLKIDQTRFICSDTNVFRGAVLEWTGDHKIAGYGYLNINGKNQMVSDIVTPQCEATDEMSFVVTNGVSSIVGFSIEKTVKEDIDCYAKFDGPITLHMNAPNTESFKIYLHNRHHLMSGELQISKSTYLDGDASMAKVTRLYACNSSTLKSESTAADVFASVTKLELASCNMNFDATAVASFPVDKIDIKVNSAAASITLPTSEGAILKVNTLTDTKLTPNARPCGVYTNANYSKITSGTIWVQKPYTANAAKWVGGGTSTSLADGANWEGGTAPDMLNFVTTCPNFAPDATGSAAVDNTYKFNGILFDSPGGFTLTKSGENSAIELYGDIVTTNSNSATDTQKRSYVIEPELRLKANVVANVGAEGNGVGVKDTLTLKGGLTGSNTLTKKGFGTLVIDGADDFTGSITHSTSNSTIIFSGNVGAEGSQGMLTVTGNNQCLCWLSNAVVRMKCNLNGPTTSPSTVPGYAVRDTWLLAMAGTTNVIYDKISTSGATAWFKAQSKAKLTIHGGYENTSKLAISGGGEICFTDKPLICYTRNNGEGYVEANASTLTLDAENCEFRRLRTASGGTVRFTRDNVLKVARSVMRTTTYKEAYWIYSGYNLLEAGYEYGSGVYDFTTTTQHAGYVLGVHKNGSTPDSLLTGAYGSRLVIRQTPYGSVETSLEAPVNGALSVEAMLSNKVDTVFSDTLKIVGVKNSAGDLIATAGTLELAAGASWFNGTNFTARGDGKLKLNAANQINPQIAALHFIGNGIIDIPDGVVQRVRSADVNGIEVASGTYVASELQEGDPLYGRIGSGTLKIAAGTMFIIK